MTKATSSTSAFRKSSTKRSQGRRHSEIETACKVWGSVSESDVLWWLQLEEEVDGWRHVQDFGFAQGKQPYKQTCPRCGGWMWRCFFFFFLYCCLWLQWIWLVASGGDGGWMWWPAVLGWERERGRKKIDKERIFKWSVKKNRTFFVVRNIIK